MASMGGISGDVTMLVKDDLNDIPTDMKRLIFKLLTDYTDQLENNKQYLKEDIERQNKVIIRINDVAYSKFNV